MENEQPKQRRRMSKLAVTALVLAVLHPVANGLLEGYLPFRNMFGVVLQLVIPVLGIVFGSLALRQIRGYVPVSGEEGWPLSGSFSAFSGEWGYYLASVVIEIHTHVNV